MQRGFFYKIRRYLQVKAYQAVSPEFVSRLYFRILLGYKLNLKNPRTLNEKLQWLKLYYYPKDFRAIQCADKYAVREYIKRMGKEELLNDILFVWDGANEIKWEELPKQFVLKCNHGSRYNIIVRDKKELDEMKVKRQLNKWLKEDFSKFNAEPHYGMIPKKIICEKYLGSGVINYNIYCFNGKAVFFSLAGGLGDGVGEHLTYYYPDGTKAAFKNRAYPIKECKLSPLLPEMIKTAEFLAKDFPMVRVDLYDVNGRIVFSEMTFTPGGALIPLEPVKSDFEMGKRLNISDVMKRRK